MVIQAKPKLYLKEPKLQCRKVFHKIAKWIWFDRTVTICIILNVVVLMLNWYEMPERMDNAMDIVNEVFVGIFTLEAIIKIIAFGGRYFKDGWNIFDLIILIGSLIGVFISELLHT